MGSCATVSRGQGNDALKFRFPDGSITDVPVRALARSPTLQVIHADLEDDAEFHISVPQHVLSTWVEYIEALPVLSENQDSVVSAPPNTILTYLKVRHALFTILVQNLAKICVKRTHRAAQVPVTRQTTVSCVNFALWQTKHVYVLQNTQLLRRYVGCGLLR